MHAKLPAMMIVRKIHSSTTSAIGLTVKPVRAASSSLIVGRSVNVKIVPSTAHQTISRTRAQGTLGRGENASGSCIAAIVIDGDRASQETRLVGYRTRSRAANFRRCRSWRGGRVAEGGGLLNRYRALKPYRGFESPLLRAKECPMINGQCPMIIGHWPLVLRFPPLLEHQPHECVDGVVV